MLAPHFEVDIFVGKCLFKGVGRIVGADIGLGLGELFVAHVLPALGQFLGHQLLGDKLPQNLAVGLPQGGNRGQRAGEGLKMLKVVLEFQHVILRRDYPDQPVPEQSLMEAATLCALKSYRKDDAKAEVLLARVKDVRKVKGAAIGSVAVDEVERTLLVGLDQEMEERLRVEASGATGPPGAAPSRPRKKA